MLRKLFYLKSNIDLSTLKMIFRYSKKSPLFITLRYNYFPAPLKVKSANCASDTWLNKKNSEGNTKWGQFSSTLFLAYRCIEVVQKTFFLKWRKVFFFFKKYTYHDKIVVQLKNQNISTEKDICKNQCNCWLIKYYRNSSKYYWNTVFYIHRYSINNSNIFSLGLFCCIESHC